MQSAPDWRWAPREARGKRPSLTRGRIAAYASTQRPVYVSAHLPIAYQSSVLSQKPNMSESPPKTQGEEHGAVQSPVVGEDMDGANEQYPEGYDQNVKEQDRWLPIANGSYYFLYSRLKFCVSFVCPLFVPCVTSATMQDNACLAYTGDSTRMTST
jgi:hypothetical protein